MDRINPNDCNDFLDFSGELADTSSRGYGIVSSIAEPVSGIIDKEVLACILNTQPGLSLLLSFACC
jgi:hypothetical protein